MKMILKILGTICILYGIGVNVLVTSRTWFNWIFCIAGAFLLALGFLWKYIVRLPLGVKIALLAALVLCLTNFVIVESRIIKTAHSVPDGDAKWVIVLGAKVNNSGVSLEFARRIDAAAEFAKSHPDAVIVTTGGKGDDEPEAEGSAAADRLVSHGIDKSRIIVESKSDSTMENFLFAKELMEKEGYGEGDCVVIVSSAFHLYRAGKLAKACGFENVSFLGAWGKKYLMPQYYLREYAAIVFESAAGRY